MAEASVHGGIHRKSSGDRPSCTERNRPPPPHPKRSRSPRDLISALPDAVIHHVFSFLSLRDVVKTSVLSKRWRSTWTTTAHLIFDGGELEDRPRSTLGFPSLVDRVLSQCTSPTVKRFHVTGFEYEKPHRRTVDLWLRFAEQCHVEDLRLSLNFPPTFHRLPRFLYCSSWLVRLEVSCCSFSLGRSSSWPCLKVLLIEFSDLRDDILEGIFRNSPVLASVQLRECRGVNNIMIDSTSVKEFILAGLRSSCTTKIWAPNLLSLWVSGGWFYRAVFRLDDISSLVEAELDFNIMTDLSGDERVCCDSLKEVLEKLRRVPTITIGGWCLQILSLLEMEGVPSPLSKCQNLILRAPVSPWDLPGIAYMLQSSQCLEKLVIHLTDFPLSVLRIDKEFKERFNFDEEEDLLCSRKGNFQCLAKHLKRVEIDGFKTDRYGLKHLLALIKLLLGDTLALEKMIIKAELRTGHTAVHPEQLVVSRNVLSYQRASKNAEVIFNYPFE